MYQPSFSIVRWQNFRTLSIRSQPVRRSLDDYDLEKQLYRGKASLLYSATCRHSGLRVVLKLYRKHKLSELNWYQVMLEEHMAATTCYAGNALMMRRSDPNTIAHVTAAVYEP